MAALTRLAEHLIAAAIATRASEALLLRQQAALLGWLAQGDRVHRCGFSTLGTLALEVLGIATRTVRERLVLHRLLTRFPALEQAFLGGRLTACQVLAVEPVLAKIDPADEEAIGFWVETAGRLSVRSLRRYLREMREEEKAARGRTRSGATGASGDQGAGGGMPGASSLDPTEIPEGRRISFSAPVAFQVVFDETLEIARKVIGREAPIHECITAILTETNWLGVGTLPETPRYSDRLDRIPILPRAVVPHMPEAIRHARETIASVREYIDDVRAIIESHEPRNPHDALTSLRQIHFLRAPQRVLFAHLIRDLRRTYAMDLLGYRSLAELVEDRLALSERSARNRVAESLLFEKDAGIEEAVGRGEISLMQAHLIRRLRRMAVIAPFLRRAREVTWRQLQRECRLLELLEKCSLGHLASRPLPQAEVEEVLIEALGGDREKIEAALRERGVMPLPEGSSSDPAENPILMDRLEALVGMLALTKWDELPETGLRDRQTSAARDARVRIRFWLPHPIADDLESVISRFRRRQRPILPTWAALVVFFAQAVKEWVREDPERRPVRARILKRDGYRCVIPGCRNRAELEGHHMKPRAQGGSESDANLATVCAGHHRGGIHKGYVRIWGVAPHGLNFELGCRTDGPPLMRLRGNRIIKRPFEDGPAG